VPCIHLPNNDSEKNSLTHQAKSMWGSPPATNSAVPVENQNLLGPTSRKGSDKVADETDSMTPSSSGSRGDSVSGAVIRAEPSCVFCGSKDIEVTRNCLNCGEPGVSPEKTVLHLVCHYLNFETKFHTSFSSRLVCPQCNRALSESNSDYVALGTLYYCRNCEAFEAKANIVSSCKRCLKVHEHQSSEMVSYGPQSEGHSTPKIGNRASLTSLFGKELNIAGWNLLSPVELLGRSGIRNTFSLVAYRSKLPVEKEEKRKLVVFDFLTDDYPIESRHVHSFFARALDCGVKHRIMIVIPKLDESAKKLADSYGMSVIEAPDALLAADMIPSALDKLLPLPSLIRAADFSQGDSLDGSDPRRSRSRSSKRSSVDIIADILKVALNPVSKSEIMACANMSYEQCQKYLPRLEKVDLVRKYLEDGVHARYQTTEKGREYVSNLFGEFGTIMNGEKSVWSSKRGTL